MFGRSLWRVRLTARGLGLGLAGLLGVAAGVIWQRQDALFVGLVALLALVAGVLGGLAGRAPRVLARAVPPGVVPFGDQITVALAGSFDPDQVVQDMTPGGVVRARPAGGAYVYGLTADLRGRFELGPARLVRLAPLGVARLTRRVAGLSELLVAPRIVPVHPPRLRFDIDETSSKVSPKAIRETDPTSVRDYRSGDPRRLVHWRATARRGKLMVRGDKPKATSDIWLAVDTAPPPGEAFEAVMSLAASLLRALAATGHVVRLVTTGGTVAGPFVAGKLDPAWAFFARLAPEAVAPDWGEVVAEGLPGRGGRVPVVAVVDRPDGLGLGQLARSAEPAVLYTLAGSGAPGWDTVAVPPDFAALPVSDAAGPGLRETPAPGGSPIRGRGTGPSGDGVGVPAASGVPA
jgi:hypothetical protein